MKPAVNGMKPVENGMQLVVNGEEQRLPSRVRSLLELITHFELDPEITVAEINQQIPVKTSYHEVFLKEGDTVELIRFMGGGQERSSVGVQDKLYHLGVYPVVTNGFTGRKSIEEAVEAIVEGGARILQLRLKNVSDQVYFNTALNVRQMTHSYGCLLIINDRVDIALAVDADGVHLGQHDLPLKIARKILGTEKIIGVSTHNITQIQSAQKEGATYLNIGPVFPTQTKQTSVTALGIENLATYLPLCAIPVTVMGGIKRSHLQELKNLGIHNVAMVTEITLADDISARVKECNHILLKTDTCHS